MILPLLKEPIAEPGHATDECSYVEIVAFNIGSTNTILAGFADDDFLVYGYYRGRAVSSFVGMKQKTQETMYPMSDVRYGDARCYIGFEANTTLVLSWHVGKRTPEDTYCFMEKLEATATNELRKAGAES